MVKLNTVEKNSNNGSFPLDHLSTIYEKTLEQHKDVLSHASYPDDNFNLDNQQALSVEELELNSVLKTYTPENKIELFDDSNSSSITVPDSCDPLLKEKAKDEEEKEEKDEEDDEKHDAIYHDSNVDIFIHTNKDYEIDETKCKKHDNEQTFFVHSEKNPKKHTSLVINVKKNK